MIHEFHVCDVEIFRFGLNGRAMPGLVASWRYSIDLGETFRGEHNPDGREARARG